MGILTLEEFLKKGFLVCAHSGYRGSYVRRVHGLRLAFAFLRQTAHSHFLPETGNFQFLRCMILPQ